MKQYADDTTMLHATDSVSELEEVLEKDLVGLARLAWVDTEPECKENPVVLDGEDPGARVCQDDIEQ